MSDRPQKIFVGNGQQRTVNGKGLMSVVVNLDELIKAAAEHGFDSQAGRKMRLDIWEMNQPDQYKNTHSVQVNTWKPDASRSRQQPQQPREPYESNQQAPAPPPPPAPAPANRFAPNDGSVDDIPF